MTLLPFLLLPLLPLLTPTALAATTDLQRLSRAHLEFGLNLFRSLRTGEGGGAEGNILFSPYSIATLLSQLLLATPPNSSSHSQLEKGLGYRAASLPPARAHPLFLSATPPNGPILSQANALFLIKGVEVEPSFRANLSRYYNTSLLPLPEGDALAALETVNAFVREKTRGRIPTLLDTLSPDTEFVLVNALSLDVAWKTAFDPKRTADRGIFHVDGDTRLEMPMMAAKLRTQFGSSSALGARMAELPFRGGRLSMFLLLPEEGRDLSSLEANLTAPNLKGLFASVREETLHLRLPRFRLSQRLGMGEALERLGISDIFSPETANLTLLTNQKPLSVSALAHSVTLEVSEKGASGAAASAAGIERFGDFGGESFEVNRPFLFFIWDYHSGALLFFGRVKHPEPNNAIL